MKKILRTTGVTLFWLAVWAALAAATGKTVLLPSPLDTVKSLTALAVTGKFWLSCFFSLARILAGLAAGALTGALTAALTVHYKACDALISPILSIIRATPVASFIILALVWLGRGLVPSFAAFLMVTPVVWSSVQSAARSISRETLEMADIFGINGFSRVRRIYLPGVLPSFAASLRTSMGLSWKAGVAAEVLCTPAMSIGTNLYSSKVYLETSDLFAWTATVIILSVLLEKLLDAVLILADRKKKAERRMSRADA